MIHGKVRAKLWSQSQNVWPPGNTSKMAWM